MADFDPYYQWLAIPPAEQPPNLYRLLGVTLFETNLDVLSAAADRQMSHVRSYQNGPHSADSQRLLNELAHARLTLLRPASKAAYDTQLQQKLPPSASARTSQPLKTARPLKTATPLAVDASTPSASSQPHVPERLIRPQPMLQAAAPEPAAEPKSAKPPPQRSAAPTAESRRARGNVKLIRSLVGVVIGGLMGTYLAGVILNALGAELPAIAQGLPGMRPRATKAVEAEQPPKSNNVTDQQRPSIPATAATAQESDVWPVKPEAFHPVVLPPGKHQFYFDVHPGRGPHVRIDSRSPSGSPISGRLVPLHEVLARSGNTAAGFGSDDTSVFLSSRLPPTTDGMMVLGVSTLPQAQIRESTLTVQVHSDLPNAGGMVFGGVYREFNAAQMRFEGKIDDYKTLKPGDVGNAYFGGTISSNAQTIYLVANIRLVPNSKENLRIWLSKAAPPFATITIAANPPAVVVTPNTNSIRPQPGTNPKPPSEVFVPSPMPEPATRPQDQPRVTEVDPPVETKPARLPKPSDDEIQAARKVVRDLYSGDYAKANTPDRKKALATKIRQVGDDTTDAPASRYACLFEAATLLTDAEEPGAYFAWDDIARQFECSVAREKSALLDRLQKRAKIPSDHKFLADGYIKLVNEAVQADDYPLAHTLSNKAEACVKRAGDDVLERTIERGVKDIRQMQTAYEEARSAKKTLAETPGDAAAGFMWGRYLCLYRGQWSEGLELLARGSESEPLVALAKTDLEKPKTAKAQEEVAAGWWKAAEGEKSERAQRQLRSRATYWYKQAIASTSGIQAARMQARIDESEAENSPIPVGKPFDVLSMIDVAAHGLAGRWHRDKSYVAVTVDNNSATHTTELAVPIAIHGDYAFTTRIEWASISGRLMFRLPVADRFVNLTVGDNMRLDVASNVKSSHPAAPLERGKRYEVDVSVTSDDSNATVEVKLNSRPYLSWTGPLTDLLDGGIPNAPPGPGFSRRRPTPASPSSGELSTQPMLRIIGQNRAIYMINTLQLQIDKGYGEPVVNVGRAYTQGRF